MVGGDLFNFSGGGHRELDRACIQLQTPLEAGLFILDGS
jgi:hypothetical protein